MMRLYFKRSLKKLRLLVYFMPKTAYEKKGSKKAKNVHCQKKLSVFIFKIMWDICPK